MEPPHAPERETAVFENIYSDKNRSYTNYEIYKNLTASFIKTKINKYGGSYAHKRLESRSARANEKYITAITDGYRRIFLILLSMRIPQDIFQLVDIGFNDFGLPYSLEHVKQSLVNPDFHEQFFEGQERFIVRPLRSGEHMDYKKASLCPFIFNARKDEDTMTVGSRFDNSRCIIKRMQIYRDYRDLLDKLKKLHKHKHIEESLATFTFNERLHVVYAIQPQKLSLWHFLSIPLDKGILRNKSEEQQQFAIINWMNCLANAVWSINEYHRSFKLCPRIDPLNIFIQTAGYHISLGVGNPDITDQGPTETQPGPKDYDAPGAFRDMPHIFSLGCVFADMLLKLYGRSVGELRQVIYQRFAKRDHKYMFKSKLPEVETFIKAIDDEDIKKLVLEMIQWKDRPTPMEVLERLDKLREDCFPSERFCCQFRRYRPELFRGCN